MKTLRYRLLLNANFSLVLPNWSVTAIEKKQLSINKSADYGIMDCRVAISDLINR